METANSNIDIMQKLVSLTKYQSFLSSLQLAASQQVAGPADTDTLQQTDSHICVALNKLSIYIYLLIRNACLFTGIKLDFCRVFWLFLFL